MANKINLTGTKTLITAGALAGTIGGWLVLSYGSGNSGTGQNALMNNPALENYLLQPLPTPANPALQNFAPADPAGSGSAQAADQPGLRVIPTQQYLPPWANPPVITQSSR